MDTSTTTTVTANAEDILTADSIGPSDDILELFTKAYDDYKDAIFRYCYFHAFDREQAKDLLQETFSKAWEYLSAGNSIRNVRAFLYRIAKNLIINAAKKKKSLSLESLQEQGFDPSGPDDEFRRDCIEEERVFSLLGTIEEPYRNAVVLRYVEGLLPAEIADLTGENVNAVSVRIHRGLKQLRAAAGARHPVLPAATIESRLIMAGTVMAA